MKLDEPKTYRMLFAMGLTLAGIGIIFENIFIMTLGLISLVLSKLGMRREHKAKKNLGVYNDNSIDKSN